MGVTIFRPGQRLVIPGVQVMQTGASTATPRWLEGGIIAANCIAAYEPKGAADLAASYINLANPGTYTVAPGVSPTFNTSDGWTFNGSTQYLLAAPVANDVYSVLVKFSNLTIGTNKCLVGAYHDLANSATFAIQCNDATNFGYFNGGIVSTITSANATSGIHAIAGKSVYKNNNTLAATIAAGTQTTALTLAIGALYYRNTTPVSFAAVKIQAIYLYNKILSSGEIASQMATGIAAV